VVAESGCSGGGGAATLGGGLTSTVAGVEVRVRGDSSIMIVEEVRGWGGRGPTMSGGGTTSTVGG
jgi:hypothetical protein